MGQFLTTLWPENIEPVGHIPTPLKRKQNPENVGKSKKRRMNTFWPDVYQEKEEIENDQTTNINTLIENPGFSNITQSILGCLDHNSQMTFRGVCQSWKAHVEQPYFWIKKLDTKGQSKDLQNAWMDLVQRIQKGSHLEKLMTECLKKWYRLLDDGLVNVGPTLDGITPIFIVAQYGHLDLVKFVASFTDDINAPKTNIEFQF